MCESNGCGKWLFGETLTDNSRKLECLTYFHPCAVCWILVGRTPAHKTSYSFSGMVNLVHLASNLKRIATDQAMISSPFAGLASENSQVLGWDHEWTLPGKIDLSFSCLKPRNNFILLGGFYSSMFIFIDLIRFWAWHKYIELEQCFGMINMEHKDYLQR